MMAKQPRYRTFTIPKKGGGEREIETPFADLKKVQSYISNYLQSTYYFEKSSSASNFHSIFYDFYQLLCIMTKHYA